LIPGHQIVGDIVDGATVELPIGTRVGVSWMGGVDGDCPYCRRGFENLCDSPAELDDLHAAPLLCAGIIGFRSLRVAGVGPKDRVGLFGFGASAHLAIAVLHAWNCEVYVATRGESHRKLAASLGAKWVGTETDKPPVELDRAVTFAPSGDVVIAALATFRCKMRIPRSHSKLVERVVRICSGGLALPPRRLRRNAQAGNGARRRPRLIRLSAITPSPTHLLMPSIP
jgi:alcohol dehydrogenase, propanol-preferring